MSIRQKREDQGLSENITIVKKNKSITFNNPKKSNRVKYINSSEKSKIIAAGGSLFNGINKKYLWKNHNVKVKKIS